jgi:hypothetical protein
MLNDIGLTDLINEQIDEAIDTAPYMSTLFRNPTVDKTHIGVTNETDFYLGAMWATALNLIVMNIARRYKRRPTDTEQMLALKIIYDRAPDFKQAIQKLGL